MTRLALEVIVGLVGIVLGGIVGWRLAKKGCNIVDVVMICLMYIWALLIAGLDNG